MHKLLLVFVLILSTAHAHIKSDSGIKGPSYQSIVANLQELADNSNGLVKIMQYGVEPKGRPLIAVKIESPVAQFLSEQRNSILITGATHGNEYLNIADRLPDWFKKNRENPTLKTYLDNGGSIYIVPIVNPYGYDRRSRYNSARVDLNRDFDLPPENIRNFKEDETKYLSDFIDDEINKQNLSLKITVDYHCCDGSMLSPWAYSTSIQLPAPYKQRFDHVGNLMQSTISRGYRVGPTGAILATLLGEPLRTTTLQNTMLLLLLLKVRIDVKT